MPDKIAPCIWYDVNQAEEAAKFYVSLGLPDSRIDTVARAPADNPSTKADDVLVVEFTLAGKSFVGLNGGPIFPQTEAISFQIYNRRPGRDRPAVGRHRRQRRRGKHVRLVARTAGGSTGRSPPRRSWTCTATRTPRGPRPASTP
jgi:hypothetical protein